MFGVLVLLLSAAPAGGTCSAAEWDRDWRACIHRSGLAERLAYFDGQVREMAARAGITGRVRVRAAILPIRERFAQVQCPDDGACEIRVSPVHLDRNPLGVLPYFAAHEVCHIANGDASQRVWGALNKGQKDDRHARVEACALGLLGRAAYGEYLREGIGMNRVQREQVIRHVEQLAESFRQESAVR